MNDTVIQLQDFILSSENVTFDSSEMNNVLPGKYLVLKHIVSEDQDNREGNLYIIHEAFADESIPLSDYYWQQEGSFDYEDYPVAIKASNYKSTMNAEQITEKLDDNMADVIDNGIFFTMPFSDFGYDFNILTEGNQIVGFNVQNIGSSINTPNVKLNKACRDGNLEHVRELLTNPNPEKRANLDYSAFYFACTQEHKDVIVYLMSSPELTEHSKINNKEEPRFNTPFIILCNSNPKIVQELIMELPEEPLNEIKEFLSNSNNISNNRNILIETLNQRQKNLILPQRSLR